MNHDGIEAIKQLKYRYLRTLDLKQWEDFTECFLPEATGDYAGLAFEDRDTLVAYMRENLGEALSEVIDVDALERELIDYLAGADR